MVLLVGVVFAGGFFIQVRARQNLPWKYWPFVTADAVFGAMVAYVSPILLALPCAVAAQPRELVYSAT